MTAATVTEGPRADCSCTGSIQSWRIAGLFFVVAGLMTFMIAAGWLIFATLTPLLAGAFCFAHTLGPHRRAEGLV